MVPFDKDRYWKEYTEYMCIRDSRDSNPGNLMPSAAFFCPVPAGVSDLYLLPYVEISKAPEAKTGPGPVQQKEQEGEETFYGKYKTIIDIAVISLLVIVNCADMVGVALLAKKYISPLADIVFNFLKLETIDPSVWDAELCLTVMKCVLAFVLAGFASFFVQKLTSKVIISLKKNKATVAVTVAMPFLFLIIPLVISLFGGFTPENLTVLFSMAGGLFYLILARINLDIPVDSNKI